MLHQIPTGYRAKNYNDPDYGKHFKSELSDPRAKDTTPTGLPRPSLHIG
jgi:hypothetical protein